MTTETLLIVLIRLIVPLTIFRWPLAGGVLALVADALDIVLASLIDLGGLWNYHALDKYLDTYYMGIEQYIAYVESVGTDPILCLIGLYSFLARS